MISVCVAIFAYRRPEHLRKVLTALLRAKDGCKYPIFIFSDGPKNQYDFVAVAAVRSVAASFLHLADISIVRSELNRGLADSIISGVTFCFTKFDRVIVLEDDVVVDDDFLMFVCDSLERYSQVFNVFSVCAYSIGTDRADYPLDYFWDVYYSYRPSPWGWATWKDRWLKIDWNVDPVAIIGENNQMKAQFNNEGEDLYRIAEQYSAGANQSWWIRFAFCQFSNSYISVFPVFRLSANIGFDGSGENCIFSDVRIDFARRWHKLTAPYAHPSVMYVDERIQKLTAKYYESLNSRYGVYKFFQKIMLIALRLLRTT